MKKPLLAIAVLSCSASFVEAQVQAILFTGRFPFVSLDAPNDPGGVITQLSEFDFSYSIPVPGGLPARSLMKASAMHCYLGDGNQDGNYLKFRDWKAGSVFTAIGVDGLFVKDADRSSVTFDKIYWTPKLIAGYSMEVLTNNGTPASIVAGDWVRFLPNGNVEFFMTQAQMQVACGMQGMGGSQTVIGAGALVQAANGDLFYAPIDSGHWVNGNQTGLVFAQDGALLKIDAANITYDASGNVANFAPDSARILINEAAGGPGGTLTVRGMVDNSGSFDRTGIPIVTAGVYGKTGGLAFDPNGGTWTPIFPDAAGNFTPEPNLIFCSNAGSYGGTIWSTNNSGEVATINGALCGSTTAGVPANGSWLGVQLDLPNFQPTLLGMTLIELPDQPLICDQADYGSLPVNTTQASWQVDFYGAPGQAVFALIDVGPQPPALIVPSFPISLIPLGFDGGSWPDLYLQGTQVTFGVGITDSLGYLSLSAANPNNGAFAGFTVTVQGAGLAAGGFELSSPVIVQLQ